MTTSGCRKSGSAQQRERRGACSHLPPLLQSRQREHRPWVRAQPDSCSAAAAWLLCRTHSRSWPPRRCAPPRSRCGRAGRQPAAPPAGRSCCGEGQDVRRLGRSNGGPASNCVSTMLLRCTVHHKTRSKRASEPYGLCGTAEQRPGPCPQTGALGTQQRPRARTLT